MSSQYTSKEIFKDAISSIAPFKSELASFKGYKKPGSEPLDIPAVIPQTERLFTTRSRSATNNVGGGNRGERAYIKVLTTDNTQSLSRTSGNSSLGTSSGGVLQEAITGTGYNSFLITDVSCSLEEKLQIVETFGDAEVSYYFGRQPILFNFSGLLMDSIDNNWFVQWLEMYSNVLRGTELARNYELIRLVLPNMTLEGTITRTSWSQNSARDVDIPFQFGFLAKRITPKPVILLNTPLTNDPVIKWDSASDFLTKSGQNSIKASSIQENIKDLQQVISDPLSSVKDYATSMTNFNSLGSGMSDIASISDAVSGVSSSVKGGLEMLTTGMTPAKTSLESIADSVSGGAKSLVGLFSGIGSNLSGIRASLFSPIYGVINSLTKLIRSVGGDISSVIGAFTNPIRDVLRDIRNISNQAIGVVNLINSTIHGASNQISNFDSDIKNTLSLLKRTAGVITSSPKSISSSLRELSNSGRLPQTTKFIGGGYPIKLNSGGRVTNDKMLLLNSGKKHTTESGARL